MMQIVLNEQGFVKAYALVGSFGADAVEVAEPENLVDFEENYRSYCLSAEGVLVKSEDKQAEIVEKRALAALRKEREKVCFPYVNRGELWYGRLSDAEKAELNTWYQAWLDVTDTKVVPETPEWLIE